MIAGQLETKSLNPCQEQFLKIAVIKANELMMMAYECDESRERAITITKIEEAMLWFQHLVFNHLNKKSLDKKEYKIAIG